MTMPPASPASGPSLLGDRRIVRSLVGLGVLVQIAVWLVVGRASGGAADGLRVLLGALVLVGAGAFGVGGLLGLARLMWAQPWIDGWLPAVQRTAVLVWVLFSGAAVLSIAPVHGMGGCGACPASGRRCAFSGRRWCFWRSSGGFASPGFRAS